MWEGGLRRSRCAVILSYFLPVFDPLEGVCVAGAGACVVAVGGAADGTGVTCTGARPFSRPGTGVAFIGALPSPTKFFGTGVAFIGRLPSCTSVSGTGVACTGALPRSSVAGTLVLTGLPSAFSLTCALAVLLTPKSIMQNSPKINAAPDIRVVNFKRAV